MAQSPQHPVPAAHPPHSFAQLRGGAVSVTPAIELLNVGIDTNVLNLDGTQYESPDFTATLQPRIDTLLKLSSFTAQVVTLGDFIYYRKYKSERSINPRFELNLEQRIGQRFALWGFTSGGAFKTRTDLEVDARVDHRGVSGAAGGRWRTRRVDLDVHASRAEIRYSRAAYYDTVQLAESLDRTANSIGTVLAFKLSPYTALTAGDEVTQTRFVYAKVRDFDTNRAAVGLQFNPRAMISGTAELGYLIGRPRSALTPDFAGFAPRVGVGYRLSDTTTFSAGARRELEFSYKLDRPYYVRVTYDAAIRQAIAHFFDVGVSVERNDLSYRSFVGGDFADKERLRGASVALGVPVTKGLRVDVYVGEWQRYQGSKPYRTRRAGVQITTRRLKMNDQGVFLNGLNR